MLSMFHIKIPIRQIDTKITMRLNPMPIVFFPPPAVFEPFPQTVHRTASTWLPSHSTPTVQWSRSDNIQMVHAPIDDRSKPWVSHAPSPLTVFQCGPQFARLTESRQLSKPTIWHQRDPKHASTLHEYPKREFKGTQKVDTSSRSLKPLRLFFTTFPRFTPGSDSQKYRIGFDHSRLTNLLQVALLFLWSSNLSFSLGLFESDQGAPLLPFTNQMNKVFSSLSAKRSIIVKVPHSSNVTFKSSKNTAGVSGARIMSRFHKTFWRLPKNSKWFFGSKICTFLPHFSG